MSKTSPPKSSTAPATTANTTNTQASQTKKELDSVTDCVDEKLDENVANSAGLLLQKVRESGVSLFSIVPITSYPFLLFLIILLFCR